MKVPGHLHVEELKLAPGQEWKNAGGSWRFLRIVTGAAYWLESARPRALTAGEVLVLGPAALGVVRASQLNQVVLHEFGFAPEMLCGFFTLGERHFFETGLAGAASEIQFLPSTHPLARRFAALAARVGPAAEMSHRAELLGIAGAFFGEKMSRRSRSVERGVFAQARFEQLIARMPDLEIIHHTPEELARLCGCSARHFNRLFRECFGQSPRARQTELRLLKASHLLAMSGEKVVDIALASGYRSLSLFNSLFKKRFGISPSRWRARASKPPQ
jgi:AraC-like DNA-binding protein